MSESDDQALEDLRKDLLRDRARPLAPGEGEEAQRQHKILAIAVHRATLLDQRGKESQTDTWIRYLTRYWPAGRNSEADASALWVDWRTRLIKDAVPGPRISITHGQSELHWHREDGELCINLEDMWSDFAESIDRFIADMKTNDERRQVVLARFNQQSMSVRLVRRVVGTTMSVSAVSGSKLRSNES